MSLELQGQDTERFVIFKEDDKDEKEQSSLSTKPWKILIVDDEQDVHEITRITLRGVSFDNRPIKFFSAFSAAEVKTILNDEEDIALILLDVVMEKDNTGLELVNYIRTELKNAKVRIVLRTGQPGKAPEQEVITRFDINDYKTKPEFTAQKLYTSVVACLRAYQNIDIIEKNAAGLKHIIESSGAVFKNQSFSEFGKSVLDQLKGMLQLPDDSGVSCAYLVGMPNSSVVLISGTGQFDGMSGASLASSMPQAVITSYEKYGSEGFETFEENEYIGIFHTEEGFISILFIENPNGFSNLEKNLIRIYANNIAIGFDNISLAREIINTQKEVILTLGEIVETRSKETAHHVTRVAEVCYLLAKKAGLDEKACETIRLASPMHDVGKIGIPEAILNKPGRLTDEEFNIIQTHAQTGFEILKNSNRSIMKAAAIVALQHHEKWNGTGYPQGLAGEEIHIFGRIGAIADVFDALSHDRCYKSAWPMEKIISLFETESGKHFDPELIHIFLTNVEEFKAINRRFPE
jgi:response regulator RpfG family c-di-GMP phosphodiesterase